MENNQQTAKTKLTKEERKQLRREKKFTKVEKSWIMYDWANSVYATNIMAAIFPIYFAIAAEGSRGEQMFGYAVSAANLLVALMAPLLGAVGDFKGMKKKLFTSFLLIGLVFTTVMAFVGSWQLMLIGMVISRIGFSGSILFYDSFLTDVTNNDRMDRVSAWGYAMGYIGGSTIPFVISIAFIVISGMDWAVNWYNSALPSLAASCPFDILAYKASILIVTLWWAVFTIPFLKNVHQVYSVDESPKKLAREAFRNAIRTFKDICRDKKILFFILAYFFYIDGVDTIISLATNYGSTLGLGAIGMILALLVTQIVAVPFSILYGNLSRKVGALRMILTAVIIYFVITILGFLMGYNIDRFGDNPPESAVQLSQILFWVLATLVGTVQGGIQALSRSYYGQLIPPERSNEFYGFLDIFGKFSCVIGPALYSLVFQLTGKPSFGILSIISLFFIGGIMLLFCMKQMKKAGTGAPETAQAAE